MDNHTLLFTFQQMCGVVNAGTERDWYCTLHDPQQECFIEIKLPSLAIYGKLHDTNLYVVHLFDVGSNDTAVQVRWTGMPAPHG